MPELNGFRFSEEDVKKVLHSPEGRQLLQFLNRDGGEALQRAAAALKQGDRQGVEQILSPIMETPEAARLVKKLSGE